ncbi:MAG: shikimate dehydrogenase family protein [Christensenellales bacterium]
MNVKYNLDTQLMFLVGEPLGHSVISKVFAAVFEKNNMNAIYFPVEVSAAKLGEFMKALKLFKLCGIGVAMPLKTLIGAYLDEVEDVAKMFGVVNNIAIDKNGKSHGYATDGYGMCQALENAGMSIKGRSVLILGAGGVSGIVSAELAERGAKRIIIANRTIEKAQRIADIVKSFTSIEASAVSFDPSSLDNAASQCSVLLQCTPLGMQGKGIQHEYLGFLDKLPQGSGVVDAVYNPDPTLFLEKAKEKGLLTVSGMNMFLCQLEQIFDKVFHVRLDQESLQLAGRVMKDAIAGKL